MNTFTFCLSNLISIIIIDERINDLKTFSLGFLLRYLKRDLPLIFFFLELLSLTTTRPSIAEVLRIVSRAKSSL